MIKHILSVAMLSFLTCPIAALAAQDQGVSQDNEVIQIASASPNGIITGCAIGIIGTGIPNGYIYIGQVTGNGGNCAVGFPPKSYVRYYQSYFDQPVGTIMQACGVAYGGSIAYGSISGDGWYQVFGGNPVNNLAGECQYRALFQRAR